MNNTEPDVSSQGDIGVELRAYLRVLMACAGIAVDKSGTYVHSVTDPLMASTNEVDEAALPIPLISQEEFFDELLVNRLVQDVIRRELYMSRDMICIVGSPGTGKTSVGLKVAADLRREAGDQLYITWLDARFLSSLNRIDTSSKEKADRSLRKQIVELYLGRLYPIVPREEGARSPRFMLWNYILNPDYVDQRLDEVYANFRSHSDALVRIHQRHRVGESFENWLEPRCNSDEEIVGVLSSAEIEVDVAHLVYASAHLFGFERQLFWIDNIDRLPFGAQPVAMAILRDAYQGITDHAQVIVAVREENVYRADSREYRAPPRERKVRLEQNGSEYLASDTTPISVETAAEIVGKRMRFARTHQQREFARLVAERDRCMSEPPAGSAIVKGLDRRIVDIGQPISNAGYEFVQTISRLVLDCFAKDRAIQLMNHDIRSFMMLHRDCIGYLMRIGGIENGIPVAIRMEPWETATYIFHWIRNTERRYRIPGYDVISLSQQWKRESDKSRVTGCSLPYLVLTAAWNLSMRSRLDEAGGQVQQEPAVGDVIRLVQRLGYSPQEIKQEIFHLHRVVETRNNSLELRTPLIVDEVEKVTRRMRVYVTDTGKCMAALVCTSFGYTYECIRRQSLAKPTDELPPPPRLSPEGKQAVAEEIFLRFCDVAAMHYHALCAFRKAGAFARDNSWSEAYLDAFGLPQQYPFVRLRSIGRQCGLSPYRKAFLIEAMCSSVSGYLGPMAPISLDFARLSRRFLELAMGLDSGEFYTEDDCVDFYKEVRGG